MLLTPDRFYDPDQGLLQKLFLFEENFPVGVYSEPSTLAVLREIGLRGVEDVEPEDLQVYYIYCIYTVSPQKWPPYGNDENNY